MALISIFNRRENNRPAAHPLPQGAQAAEPPASPPETIHVPPLILLTADAAGPSVRRILTFPDAESAAGHIQFWFPVSERSNVIAFWALAEEPARICDGQGNGGGESAMAQADSLPAGQRPHPASEIEVVVLIQHPEHLDSVYPFSFADMDTANRFIRDETKRGLDPRSVSICWGAFATIEQARDGSAAITPQTPPTPARTMEPVTAEPTTEPEPELDPAPTPASQPAQADPLASYTPPTEPTTLRDIINDLAEALANSRPATRPAFEGFGSPPGRF